MSVSAVHPDKASLIKNPDLHLLVTTTTNNTITTMTSNNENHQQQSNKDDSVMKPPEEQQQQAALTTLTIPVSTPDSLKKKYRQKFRKEWLKREPFVGWLREVPGDCTKANCRLCKCTIAAKYYDIVKHSETKKHVNAAAITGTMGYMDDDDDEYSEFRLKPPRGIWPTNLQAGGEIYNRKNWMSMQQASSSSFDVKPDRKDWVSLVQPSSEVIKPYSEDVMTLLQRASGVPPSEDEDGGIDEDCPSDFKKYRESFEAQQEALLSLLKLQQPEDEFDKVAAAWAVELRKMDPEQQVFAKKAVNDILFEGRLGTLNRNSGFIYNPPMKMAEEDNDFTPQVETVSSSPPICPDTSSPPHGSVSPPSGSITPPPTRYVPPVNGAIAPSLQWHALSSYEQKEDSSKEEEEEEDEES